MEYTFDPADFFICANGDLIAVAVNGEEARIICDALNAWESETRDIYGNPALEGPR